MWREVLQNIWLWCSLRSLVLALKPSFRLLHQGFLCCSKGRQTCWEGTEEEARLDKQAVAERRREEGEVLLEATVHPGTTGSLQAACAWALSTGAMAVLQEYPTPSLGHSALCVQWWRVTKYI